MYMYKLSFLIAHSPLTCTSMTYSLIPPSSPLPSPLSLSFLPLSFTRCSSSSYSQWVLLHSPHYFFPRLVDLIKHLSLIWQLPLYIRCSKYALQIKPVPLTCQPLILKEHTQYTLMYMYIDTLMYMYMYMHTCMVQYMSMSPRNKLTSHKQCSIRIKRTPFIN